MEIEYIDRAAAGALSRIGAAQKRNQNTGWWMKNEGSGN